VIVGCWDDRRPSGGAANARPLLLITTRQRDHSSLSVVVGHLQQANGDGGGGPRHTTAARLAAANCCPPSACASTDNTTSPPLPQMKSHYRHHRRLHVIDTAARAKCWRFESSNKEIRRWANGRPQNTEGPFELLGNNPTEDRLSESVEETSPRPPPLWSWAVVGARVLMDFWATL
jgi:hypothetical protein